MSADQESHMEIEYVSVEKSRSGYEPNIASDKPTPKTSVNSAANTNPGGKSASKNEEG